MSSNVPVLNEQLGNVNAHYRLSEHAFVRPGARDVVQAGRAQGWHFADGYVDVPWPVSLTPMLLPPRLLAEVERIGSLVPAALRCTWDFLTASDDARSFVFRSPKSEGDYFNAAEGYPLGDEPLFRLDLLLEHNGDVVTPWLVDVNLMAGMAGVTGAINNAYAEYADRAWGQETLPGPFNIDAWARGIGARLPSSTPDDPVIDYVVRAGHALVPDAQNVVRALLRNDIAARLTHLDELAFNDGGLMQGGRSNVRRVFRQARGTTKHSGSADIRQREEQAFRELTLAWQSGATRMDPGFHMYLESHAWSHYWRDEQFKQAFRSVCGETECAFLISRIPRTLRVVDEHRVAQSRFEVRDRHWSDLDGVVLKRADSTGGAGLKMTGWPASPYERDAVTTAIASSHGDGLLLQERVRQSRHEFPVMGPDSVPMLVSGHLKLAAYFRGSSYLGAHVLLSPDGSQRFDPASVLNLLPLFVPVYGAHG
ncbi:hypothetical protein [Streptomyces sp. NPDC059552]|uniref:hypothetical protein n=1 Tax=Streptomyces sp. NPDC059552 TaxID=3346862 RepID=UPI0036C659E8